MSPIAGVFVLIRFSLSVTVWAEQAQVFAQIIRGIAVDVVQFQWNGQTVPGFVLANGALVLLGT
jgi:hypothetical protein